jgi:hypothetical protein
MKFCGYLNTPSANAGALSATPFLKKGNFITKEKGEVDMYFVERVTK